MKLTELYDKHSELAKEMDQILTEKSAMIKTIKSLDKEDPEVEAKIEDLNTRLTEIQDELAALKADIETEESTVEAVEEAEKKEVDLKTMKNLGVKNMETKYLQTDVAVKDFADILSVTGGGNNLKVKWEEHLSKKGITNIEQFLPERLVTAITSAFNEDGTLLSMFNHTGLQGHKVAVDRSDLFGKGHKPGKQKSEKDLEPVIIDITLDAIYSYITIDNKMARANTQAAILDYVINKLPKDVVRAIERAAVVGDGLAKSHADKIESVQAVKDSELAEKVTVANTAELADKLYALDGLIPEAENRVLVISGKTLAKIKTQKTSGGDYLFPLGLKLEDIFNVKKVFTPTWIGEDTVVAFDTKAYDFDMDKEGIETHQSFILKANQHEYLAEAYAGGALVKPQAAVVITVTAPGA